MSHIPNTHWDTPHKAALQAQAKLVDTEILYDADGKPIIVSCKTGLPPSALRKIISAIEETYLM